ncbi:right-handed parallel beta-helix repeat-containing protein [Streptomyces sp. NPDC056352]|uniref:right-handed parallel beta-helix repeat-containing protein n=1 Tax=Streptomyces sp. NPDC056352 TaxID=3345791 RepID=UPI0035DD1FCA
MQFRWKWGAGLALGVAVLLLPVGAAPVAAAPVHKSCTYLVAPRGDDSADGSLGRPWKTLEHARDFIRDTGVNKDMTADVTVCLRGGRYTQMSTFRLTDADSGSNGHKVVYAAFPGEDPVVDGGKEVTGWTRVPDKPYWSADVDPSAGYASYFRQLYVGGERARLAMGKGINGTGLFRDAAAPAPYEGVTFPASALKAYTNVTDLRVMHQGQGFKEDYFPVTKIVNDGQTAKVYLQQPYFQFRSNNGSVGGKDAYYFANAFQELDNAGEWYLDQAKHKVYYYPRAGEDLAKLDVHVPVVETLVNVEGSGSAAKAHDITFDGITFEYGNWQLPGTTFIGGSQAEALFDATTGSNVYASEVPGQIKFTNTDHVDFVNNTVRYSGNGGVQLRTGVHNTQVTGNRLYNLTAAGVIAGRWRDLKVTPAERTAYNTISNNVVYNTGDDYFQGTGISLMNTYAVTVTHNLVYNTGYSGIHQRMGDESGLYDGPYGIGKTTISYNWVYNGGTNRQWGLTDSGSIYSFGAWPGTQIHHNYVSTSTTGRSYMSDNQSYQTRWDYNVADGGPFSAFTAVRPPASVYASHNYTTTTSGSGYKHFIFDVDGPPHVVSGGAWPAEAKAIIAGAGLEPAYAGLRWKVPTYNLADYATFAASSGWTASRPDKLWDGLVETGEAGGTANEAWVEYGFNRDYNGFTFRIQNDNNGTTMITDWKAQRWSASQKAWVDIMPYQSIGTAQQVSYQAPPGLATTKIRLYVKNGNPNGLVGLEEFQISGQLKG